MLRAIPEAVKRDAGQKRALPNNRSSAYDLCLQIEHALHCEMRAACTFVHKRYCFFTYAQADMR
jgi:hypothetical protein